MNSENTRDFKKKTRKEMRQILVDFHASLSEKEKHSLTEKLCQKITALPEYQNASTIFAYIPDTLEADCTPVILHALEEGKKLAVPKVDAASLKTGENRMDFYFLEKNTPLEDQLEVGTYGIREPKAGLRKWGVAGQKERDVSPAEGVAKDREAGWSEGETSPFVIVPGVAFTRGGKRLGHGKGFYDIFIEKLRVSGISPFLCGIALPCQILSDLPTGAHDALMDEVIF